MTFDNKIYEQELMKSFNIHQFDFVEEGLPLPIFYGSLFNREQNMEFEQQNNFYLVKTKYSIVDKTLLAERNQSNGEQKFDFNNKFDLQKLETKFNEFEKRFQEFVNLEYNKICYLGIPSSECGVYNIPQILAKIMNPNQEIELIRTITKDKTHIENGKRQILFDEITKGLELQGVGEFWWEKFDFVVVIDDVTTTGSSFRMVDKYLINKGVPKEKIVNYSLYKHQKVEKWNSIVEKYEHFENFRSNSQIDLIIWDFDETIVDSRKRNVEFESTINDKMKLKKGNKYFKNGETFYRASPIYSIYPGLEEIFEFLANDGMIYEIISNRYYLMEKLFYQEKLRKKIFPKDEGDGCQYVSYKTNGEYTNYEKCCWLVPTFETKIDDYTIKYLKPSPKTIKNGVGLTLDTIEPTRIIGIGNTKNDIIAYKAAGLETVLVTWGIHYRFGRDYGADHVFHNPEQLLDFLKKNTSGMYSLRDFDNGISLVAEPQINFDDN
ncbi:hypothetical protein QM962_08460 [Streptococcus hohhotensis]